MSDNISGFNTFDQLIDTTTRKKKKANWPFEMPTAGAVEKPSIIPTIDLNKTVEQASPYTKAAGLFNNLSGSSMATDSIAGKNAGTSTVLSPAGPAPAPTAEPETNAPPTPPEIPSYFSDITTTTVAGPAQETKVTDKIENMNVNIVWGKDVKVENKPFQTMGAWYVKRGGEYYKLSGEPTGNANLEATHNEQNVLVTEDNWEFFKKKLEALGYENPQLKDYLGKTTYIGYWAQVNVTGADTANAIAGKIYYSNDGNMYKYENGKWWKYFVEKDMTTLAAKLAEMQNIPEPTMISYQDLIDQLLAKLNGMDPDQMYNEAQEAAARRLGYGSADEMAQALRAMYDQMGQGIGQGQVSDEQRRATELEAQKMREEYAYIVQGMRASGHDVGALLAGDAFARNIADFRAKRDIESMNLDFAQKSAEYNALSQRWQSLFDAGTISANQYLDSQTKYWTDYIAGYSSALQSIAQANQDSLQAYQTHAQIIYSGILAELGVDQTALQLANEYWNQYMQPYFLQMQAEADAEQEQAADDQRSQQAIGNIFSAIAAILSFGKMLI